MMKGRRIRWSSKVKMSVSLWEELRSWGPKWLTIQSARVQGHQPRELNLSMGTTPSDGSFPVEIAQKVILYFLYSSRNLLISFLYKSLKLNWVLSRNNKELFGLRIKKCISCRTNHLTGFNQIKWFKMGDSTKMVSALVI